MSRNSLHLILFLSLLSVLIGAGCRKSPDGAGGELSPIPAPDFNLKKITGGRVKLADYRGKVVILNFWATWCPPCRMEIPDFVQLQKKYGEKGVQILGIGLDRGKEKALLPFSGKYKINYPILIADGRVSQAYGGTPSIPTTFVINRQGQIVKKYIGYRPKSAFEADIQNLL